MAPNPLLRLLVRGEKAAAEPINRAANSGEAADMLLVLSRLGRIAGKLVERGRATVVHGLALPSHRDVQLLEAKVERLQRTLDDLRATADDNRNTSGES